MTENDKKSSYFSNSDFEKVAADIISSPRRLKHASPAEDSLFKITPKQQEYYTKCFRHLMKTTQGAMDLSGALCGADTRIVAFFRRSALDMGSLSKIWSLADVNEDGFLDLNEFSIAMHLVVLKVKGEVPVPEILPSFARPPMTEPRVEKEPLESAAPIMSPAAVSVTRSEGKNSSSNWTSQPVIKQFSDTPPLLVDSRPTAIKHSALLALKSPLGPPPPPPSRPQQHKGHNRSASLDLKLIGASSSSSSSAGVKNGASGQAPPTTLSLWSSHHSDPAQPNSTSTTTTTTTFASFPATPDSIPPPIPQRITPSPLPRVIEEEKRLTDAATQTSGVFYSKEDVEKFFSGIGGQVNDLLGEETMATEGDGIERFNKRCAALRIQNAELETERARLAQVRIQLELRVQELEERSKTACSSSTL